MAIAVVASLAACGDGDARSRLAAATQRTFGGPVTFAATVDADDAALRDLFGDQAQIAGQVLEGLRVAGRRAGDSYEVRLSVLGLDLFDLRSVAGDTTFLRLGFSSLAALATGGGDPGERIVGLIRDRGAPEPVADAVAAVFRGDWIGVEGDIDPDRLNEVLGGPTPGPTTPTDASVGAALGEDPAGFVQRYVAVHDVTDTDRARRYDIAVQLRELLAALSQLDPTRRVEDLQSDLKELPEAVPATMQTRILDAPWYRRLLGMSGAEVLTGATFDLAALARAGAADANGSFRVQLDLSDHGSTEPIQGPDDAVTVTSEEFLEAARLLSEVFHDAAPDDGLPVPEPVPDGGPQLPVPEPSHTG
ncbi:MAG: hypothetical protein KY462_03490 [Actinobacteria bacterium]|nr:hypothetical protein [Actinomycetota bacterium]